MTTVETLTNKQIRLLSEEAGQHGDLEMVAICDNALKGDAEARRQCVESINYAEAQT